MTTQTDIEEWDNLMISCCSVMDGGDEREANDAVSLYIAVGKYDEGWLARYNQWHKENP